MKSCIQCGQLIASTRGVMYCSKQCNGRAYHERRQAQGRHNRKIHQLACIHCGGGFIGRLGAKFCTKRCASTFNNIATYPPGTRKPSRRRRQAITKRDKAAAGSSGRAMWVTGQCVICNEWFATYFGGVTCSSSCRDKHKANRRHDIKMNYLSRKRDAFVSPVSRTAIFKADGYRCHLCGRMTDPTKRVPHPKAPTVDHLIPLAANGTHEPTNCRTAHFICNSLKREHGGGEQHILFVA